jgi:hypothetical protein
MERVKRENSGLRRMLQDREGPMELDAEGGNENAFNLPAIGSEPKRRKRSAPEQGPTYETSREASGSSQPNFANAHPSFSIPQGQSYPPGTWLISYCMPTTHRLIPCSRLYTFLRFEHL